MIIQNIVTDKGMTTVHMAVHANVEYYPTWYTEFNITGKYKFVKSWDENPHLYIEVQIPVKKVRYVPNKVSKYILIEHLKHLFNLDFGKHESYIELIDYYAHEDECMFETIAVGVDEDERMLVTVTKG